MARTKTQGKNINGKPISREEYYKHQAINEVHVKALDDLVHVNSLFTLAVFVGLSFATPGQRSLENRDECDAGREEEKMLIVYEVIAFACFLLSRLVAKVLKLLLLSTKMKKGKIVHEGFDVKDFMLLLSGSSSVAGIVLLTLSIVNVVQIRIGKLSCGISETKQAVWSVVSIVGFALVIYVTSMGIAIFASFRSDENSHDDNMVYDEIV